MRLRVGLSSTRSANYFAHTWTRSQVAQIGKLAASDSSYMRVQSHCAYVAGEHKTTLTNNSLGVSVLHVPCLPLIILYVTRMCSIEVAGDVSAIPRAHSSDPPTATLRYENSCSNGPTNRPEKFIITSSVLMMMAAPVVPTCKSRNRSPKSSPNDGSMDRVANCERNAQSATMNNYF